MGNIRIECPSCHDGFEVPSEWWAGKIKACPTCKKAITCKETGRPVRHSEAPKPATSDENPGCDPHHTFFVRGMAKMADIRFHCSECGEQMLIDHRAAGRRVKCPHCEKTNLVALLRMPPPAEKSVSSSVLSLTSTGTGNAVAPFEQANGANLALSFSPDYPSIIGEVIRQRCLPARVAGAIAPKKETRAREIHGIPAEEPILLLSESGRRYVVLTTQAFYCHYSERRLPVRIPYAEFPRRKFESTPGGMDLGRGQVLHDPVSDDIGKGALLAVLTKVKACALTAETSPPTDEDRQYQFQCCYARSDPIGDGLFEGLMQGSPTAGPLTCVLKKGTLSIYHQAGAQEYIEVSSHPTDQIARVTCRAVTYGEEQGEIIRRYVGFGIGAVVFVSVLEGFMWLGGTLKGRPPSLSRFLLITVILSVVGGFVGGVIGILRRAVLTARKPASSVDYVEFHLITHASKVLLALRVPSDGHTSVLDTMRAFGWEPEALGVTQS